MTTKEFSNEFDTLLNSYGTLQVIGLKSDDPITFKFDEYEKSVFLTKAEELIVIDLYTGKNIFRESFEDTEELRRDLAVLIETYSTSTKLLSLLGLSSKSVFFSLPDNLLYITYEAALFSDVSCNSGEYIRVIPVTLDEFHRIKKNPFRGPNNRRVLRLDSNLNIVELISDHNISTYQVRYLRKPNPIILEDIGELSINNTSIETLCELNSILHRFILERAVLLALLSKGISRGSN